MFGNNANEVFEQVLAGGTEVVSFAVPADAVAGTTFARFRLSSGGGLGPTGYAADGEVEDYTLTLYAENPLRDFGDAPDDAVRDTAGRLRTEPFPGRPALGQRRRYRI